MASRRVELVLVLLPCEVPGGKCIGDLFQARHKNMKNLQIDQEIWPKFVMWLQSLLTVMFGKAWPITFDFERSADGSINAACQEGFLKIVLLLNEPSAAISILCNIGRGSTFGMVVPNPTSSRLLGTAKHGEKKNWLL